MNWKLWLYGLFTALIAAAATAASNAIVLPAVIDGLTLKKLLVAIGLNAVVAGIASGLAYLKTHPLPDWSGVERRNNVQTSSNNSIIDG